MRYVLGVDGGATKTHALIVDETGRAVGLGHGGTSNHQVRGLESALVELRRAIRMALDEAKNVSFPLVLGHFCLAGADLPEDYALLQGAVDGLGLASTAIISNDAMAALRAGLSRTWGVVVICGTGFNAAGRAPDGTTINFPGLGPISGDWGGGSEIGSEIVRRVMRAWDGRGKKTRLTRAALDLFTVPDEMALLRQLYHEQITDRDLLALVPVLFEVALTGDEAACDLIVELGAEVGITANAVIKRLGLETSDVEVVLGGSVFKGKGPLLLDTIRQVVHRQAPAARIVSLKHEPVFGASLLALEAVGVEVTHETYERLDSSLQQLPSYAEIHRVRETVGAMGTEQFG